MLSHELFHVTTGMIDPSMDTSVPNRLIASDPFVAPRGFLADIPNAIGAGNPREQSKPVARGFDRGVRSEAASIPFAVVYQGRIVGTTSYGDIQSWRWPNGSPNQRTQHPDVVEVGYTWLAHSAQRTGCNTEAKRLLLSHAFEVWRVYRVSFRTDERNERSRRAIERLGAKLEGIRRADMPSVDDRARNSAFYSIIREEWPAVRRRLMELQNR